MHFTYWITNPGFEVRSEFPQLLFHSFMHLYLMLSKPAHIRRQARWPQSKCLGENLTHWPLSQGVELIVRIVQFAWNTLLPLPQIQLSVTTPSLDRGSGPGAASPAASAAHGHVFAGLSPVPELNSFCKPTKHTEENSPLEKCTYPRIHRSIFYMVPNSIVDIASSRKTPST